jgi:hypothetical protein
MSAITFGRPARRVTEADHSAYLESIRALVAQHGHAVQQVAPDDEESLGWS